MLGRDLRWRSLKGGVVGEARVFGAEVAGFSEVGVGGGGVGGVDCGVGMAWKSEAVMGAWRLGARAWVVGLTGVNLETGGVSGPTMMETGRTAVTVVAGSVVGGVDNGVEGGVGRPVVLGKPALAIFDGVFGSFLLSI